MARTSLVTDRFRLEPLGPQHNEADHAAWTSSTEHIEPRPDTSTATGRQRGGMSLSENLADLRASAGDFTRGAGFTFTVLDPVDGDVIGCVYPYPSGSEEYDVTVDPGCGQTGPASTIHSPPQSPLAGLRLAMEAR